MFLGQMGGRGGEYTVFVVGDLSVEFSDRVHSSPGSFIVFIPSLNTGFNWMYPG